MHGIGQLLIAQADCDQLNYDSYIDLSGLKTGSELDLNTARYGAPMSETMRASVLGALAQPIGLLPDVHRNLALANLA